MTHSASEIFTVQLARAAAKQAGRFLAARGLNKADRDDVIAGAMLWCWENRDNYSLTTTLETWFMNAIRDAYKSLQRNELPSSDESMEDIKGGGEDPTYDIVAAESSAQALINALSPTDKEIAVLVMEGYTYREINRRGYANDTINVAQKRIRQLRRLMPDESRSKRLLQSAPAVSGDDADDKLSEIDIALERLDFAPPAGKDCPPCWRCMYFEGFMPDGKRATRMEIEDLEVRAAVKSTEARKIEIAQQVREGL
jgi:DNA-directed RNA polymerase specialized sigma24 family protein